MKGELFLTGATGYIGASLLQKWLASTDARLNLLVRSRRGVKPLERISKVLRELYPDTETNCFSSRIELIEGDLSHDRFGLKEPEYRDLAARTMHIIHCAAAARFDLEIEDARKVNVGGAQNILDFARVCPGLKKVDYIGTAYVAGRRKGIIKEDELDEKQEHNNTYERSKLEAEKLVRENMDALPLTILRPSIVICDSRTGRASSFNGFYRALRLYWLGLLKILPGHTSGRVDLVPVDYVTDAIYAISTNGKSAGNCYHVTAGSGNTTSLEQIRDLASRHFRKEPFAIIPPEEFMAYISKAADRLSEEEREMIEEVKLYMPYLTGGLLFDDSNTRRDAGLEVPRVSDYFGKMANYIMEHE
ncbi:MAG: SDR family oxidoreductase [Candidatus Eisenbacteria bacterium]|nr:SDR family oxidoreductase [Candidatus Eisenbacteria bacterium]